MRKSLKIFGRTIRLYSNHCINVIFLIWLNVLCFFQKKQLIIISLFEHIGDIIASEPVTKHLRQTYPSARIVFVLNKNYKELIEEDPKINSKKGIKFFSEWIMLKKFIQTFMPRTTVYDLHLNNKRCSKFKHKLIRNDCNLTTTNIYDNNRNLTQIFSVAAGLPDINEAPRFYTNKTMIDIHPTKPYIVFHTQTNAAFKDWQPELWTQLYHELSSQGYTIVEVGLNNQISATDKMYVDYTGKKSLQSIANLIADCTLFVGLDSGFAHMANALQVNGVVLMGNFIQDGVVVFEQYNPFSGLYGDDNFIAGTKTGSASTLQYAVVYNKVMKALSRTETPVFKTQTSNLFSLHQQA